MIGAPAEQFVRQMDVGVDQHVDVVFHGRRHRPEVNNGIDFAGVRVQIAEHFFGENDVAQRPFRDVAPFVAVAQSVHNHDFAQVAVFDFRRQIGSDKACSARNHIHRYFPLLTKLFFFIRQKSV